MIRTREERMRDAAMARENALRTMVHQCQQLTTLNTWEKEFLAKAARTSRLSLKQADCVRLIWRRKIALPAAEKERAKRAAAEGKTLPPKVQFVPMPVGIGPRR